MTGSFFSLIGSLPFSWCQYEFMQNALVAILLVTPILAFLGCTTVNNQMAFFSDAIGHSSLTGIAIGTLIGITSPVVSMALFSAVLAITITVLRKYAKASADTIIGIVMACTIAVGILILSRNGGFAKYSSILIGDFLSISRGEITKIILLAVSFFSLWALLFNPLFIVSSHTSIARSRKLPVWVLQGILGVIVAISVSTLIPWIGMLVINALIILPASIARNISRSLFSYHWIAVGISSIAGVVGLLLSFYLSTATGATIVCVLMVFFILTLPFGAKKGKSKTNS